MAGSNSEFLLFVVVIANTPEIRPDLLFEVRLMIIFVNAWAALRIIVQSLSIPRGFVVPIDTLKNKQRSTAKLIRCLLYTSPSPRDGLLSRMPSSA